MNVMTALDGRDLMPDPAGGLEGLRYDSRIARFCLDKAITDLLDALSYSKSEDADWLRTLAQKIKKNLADVRKAEEAERREIERRRTEATMPAHRVAYCITTLTKVEARLADRSETLLRTEVAGVRDMIVAAGVHSIPLIQN
jgi:hypothetical protein